MFYIYHAWAGSLVGIATELRAGRSGDRTPVGGNIFRTCPHRPWSPPASCTMGTGSFSRVNSGMRVTVNPHSHSSAVVKTEWSYTSTPPMGLTACTEPQCLYSRAILLLPYGPYGLYRASVPVSRAITLLPLWAVRLVQSLSACTVELYLYSPYRPYGLYRASVPVQ
jgi:hypothetical protein